MARKNRQFPGYPYLTMRGVNYRVRVQVPAKLKAVIGKGELIKSFGQDFATVKRKYHETVAEFKAQIEAAKTASGPVAAATQSAAQPSHEDIELACYEYFRRMAASMRGKVAEPVGDGKRRRKDRIEGFKVMIEHHLDAFESGSWETMATQANWLCEERKWDLSEEADSFEFLCHTMLRARLQCYRSELRILEGRLSVDPDMDPLFDPTARRNQTKVMTLGKLIDKFNEVREPRWSASTRQNYVIITRVLEEICGRDTPVREIDSDFCRNVMSILTALPANYQKIPATSGKPIGKAIEIAAQIGLKKISPATVNTHLNKLGALVRFGRDEGWIVGNPMANIKAHDPIHASEKRDPFSIEQLTAIFSIETWAQPAPSPADPRPSRYWAPLIALYTGARLTDICGQLTEEMIEQEGVPLFNFVHRPGVRRVKGERSRRVPVHSELIALGFWDYVEQVRASGQHLLFSDVKRNKAGQLGGETSKWFSRQVRALGLRGRRLSMHSFRHSFEDALRRVDLHDTPLGNALTGRATSGVSKNYGSKYPVGKLHDAIEQVAYPGFEFAKAMGAQRVR